MRSALVLGLTILGGCTVNFSFTREGVGSDIAADAMNEAWNDHFAAAEKKDAAAACDLYTDDVVYAVAGSPELRGRVAVEAMEKAGMASTTIEDVVHLPVAVRVDGDVGHEMGLVAGDVASNGAPAKSVQFKYIALWRRCTDGKWRIAHLVGNIVDRERPVH